MNLRRLVVLVAVSLLPASVIALGADSGLADLARLARESTDVAVQRDILKGIQSALAGRPNVPAPAGWTEVEAQLGKSASPEIQSLTRSLGLTFGSPWALSALREQAADRKAPIDARNLALKSLLVARSPDLVGLLQELCAEPGLRATAVKGLAQYDDSRTPNLLLQDYPNWSAENRRDAVNTLASRPGYARVLLDAVGAGRVPRGDLTADLVRQLRNLKNPDLNARLTQVWGVVHEPSADMTAEVEKSKRRYWAGGSTPGDAGRGRVVFNQICAQCHRLFDAGGQVGPDITGANRSDLDYLLQNILYPNAVIPNEYRQTVIETKDGRVLTGLLKSSDGVAHVLQTANELVTVPKAEVGKVELLETSMMPEGLLAGLNDVQMRDLLYYLSRPGQVPLPAGN